MHWCEVMATFPPYGEGYGNFTVNWNGSVCPETEVVTWRAQGYITTFGDNPVTLRFNGRAHCVDVCDDEPPNCTDEIVKLSKDIGD
jgi:hypothetical protein